MINPLILKAAPYAVVAALSFAAAWSWQSGKIDAANGRTELLQAEFDGYINEQRKLVAEASAKAAKQREESEHDWNETKKRLAEEQASGAAYKRCVAAGKCGPQRVCVVVPAAGPDNHPAGAISSSAGADGARGSTVPLGVIDDCAKVQARLNALQADIRKQPGYSK